MKGGWRIALGLLISGAALAWILASQDEALIWAGISAANFPLLILSAAVATATFPLRARRWKTILAPLAPDIPFKPLWRATSIGFALNHVLPARLGEVARAFVLSKETPAVGFGAAYASLAVDRLFDAIVLLLLFLVGVLGIPSGADSADVSATIQKVFVVVSILAAVLFVATYSLAFFPRVFIGIFEFFARRTVPRFVDRGRDILLSLAAGLSVLKSPTRFAAVFGWTLVHWLVNALAFWIGFRALGINVGFSAALFTQTAVAFAVALPQGPAYVGVFQSVGSGALLIFGVPEQLGLAWAFAYWAFSLVPITTIGLVYFAQMHISLKELRGLMRGRKGKSQVSDSVSPV